MHAVSSLSDADGARAEARASRKSLIAVPVPGSLPGPPEGKKTTKSLKWAGSVVSMANRLNKAATAAEAPSAAAGAANGDDGGDGEAAAELPPWRQRAPARQSTISRISMVDRGRPTFEVENQRWYACLEVAELERSHAGPKLSDPPTAADVAALHRHFMLSPEVPLAPRYLYQLLLRVKRQWTAPSKERDEATRYGTRLGHRARPHIPHTPAFLPLLQVRPARYDGGRPARAARGLAPHHHRRHARPAPGLSLIHI